MSQRVKSKRMIEDKDFITRMLLQLIRLTAKLRDPLLQEGSREQHELFRRCFDVAGVDIDNPGARPAAEIVDGMDSDELLLQFSDLLKRYAGISDDPAVAALLRETERKLARRGVLDFRTLAENE